MPADLRHVLTTLFDALGLGPAPIEPSDVETFEVEDSLCRVTRDQVGTAVLLEIDLGLLSREPFVAADRLRRLLRAALGLALVNRAVLVCDSPPDEEGFRLLFAGADSAPDLRFKAVARIETAQRTDIIGALQDVLQIRTVALQYLSKATASRGDYPDASTGFSDPRTTVVGGRAEEGGDFLIFQP